jgi:hypothetical protein
VGYVVERWKKDDEALARALLLELVDHGAGTRVADLGATANLVVSVRFVPGRNQTKGVKAIEGVRAGTRDVQPRGVNGSTR